MSNGEETRTVSDEESTFDYVYVANDCWWLLLACSDVGTSLITPEKTSKKKKKSKAIETGQEEERESSHSTPTVPFRRVDDTITVDMKLSNNSFEAKVIIYYQWILSPVLPVERF